MGTEQVDEPEHAPLQLPNAYPRLADAVTPTTVPASKYPLGGETEPPAAGDAEVVR